MSQEISKITPNQLSSSSSNSSNSVMNDTISEAIINELENCDVMPDNHNYNNLEFQLENYKKLIEEKEVTEKKFLGTPRLILDEFFEVFKRYDEEEYVFFEKKSPILH